MLYDSNKLKELYTTYLSNSDSAFKYQYGTAGFRYHNTFLDPVMFTTSIIAALRSLNLHGETIGIMITASHNPPQDNGVKIVEPMGEMLVSSWEGYSTDLANSLSSFETFSKKLDHIIDVIFKDSIGNNNNKIQDDIKKINVLLGNDSRESSERLSNIVYTTITTIFDNIVVNVKNIGLVTTPQLHYLTRYSNIMIKEVEDKEVKEDISSLELDNTYYPYFKDSFVELLKLHFPNIDEYNLLDYLPFQKLVIDCANGVGSVQFEKMIENDFWFTSFVEIINDNYLIPSTLNVNCGADYVKTNQRLPENVVLSSENNTENNEKNKSNLYCSFDGDADRVVFYYNDFENNNHTKFHLLDGDKIATLFAEFFKKLLVKAGVSKDELKLGTVQTAYANGSSTNYLKDFLKVENSCTKTGVKHLHHEAVSKFDIGIYFEANGHGTVIFSPKLYTVLNQKLTENGNNKEQMLALKTLKLFTKLINQAVGDAITDMLAVVAILIISQKTASMWDKEYTDLPNRLIKVIVPDRNIFETTNAERQLVSPPGLQAKIDSIVARYGENARSFVRASGTEDAVRVYAEASSIEKVEWLVSEVGELVKNSNL